jgi:hypothetical protein
MLLPSHPAGWSHDRSPTTHTRTLGSVRFPHLPPPHNPPLVPSYIHAHSSQPLDAISSARCAHSLSPLAPPSPLAPLLPLSTFHTQQTGKPMDSIHAGGVCLRHLAHHQWVRCHDRSVWSEARACCISACSSLHHWILPPPLNLP